MISAGRLIAIVSPDSAPIKRMVQEARERGVLIDASYGRRTRAVLVMDNATSAGHRDRDGEATLTHVFASFASHHRMEVRFCNPYSSNEKGNGRTRSVF